MARFITTLSANILHPFTKSTPLNHFCVSILFSCFYCLTSHHLKDSTTRASERAFTTISTTYKSIQKGTVWLQQQPCIFALNHLNVDASLVTRYHSVKDEVVRIVAKVDVGVEGRQANRWTQGKVVEQ